MAGTHILAFLSFLLSCVLQTHGYLVGTGIADCTGLVAEGLLYGYANPDQDARGLHMRQFSRAFVVADDDGTNRAAMVVAEVSMISEAVHKAVLEDLEVLYGDLYNIDNVMLLPTHSHALPGGYFTYWIYQTPTGGFIQETFDATVNGIVKSIQQAHQTLQSGKVDVGFEKVSNIEKIGINRSPYSYMNNPKEERDRYDSDIDDEMTVLRFTAASGEELGMFSFLPVHPTTLKNFNKLVSSDNKGYAALSFELEMNPGDLPGKGSFVAAFAQTTEGDVSPNVMGAVCEGTGQPCDALTSTCDADPLDPNLCQAYGPTGDMFEDVKIIGQRQYQTAKEAYYSASTAVTGPVTYVQQWVKMSNISFPDGTHTCLPAMGYSFGAGATDGPGFKPFIQGDTEGSAAIDAIVGAVLPKSDELVRCHEPKPVLLPTGEAQWPNPDWPWQPEILPLQIIRIGQLVFIGVPAEVTTMSGRRIREAVQQTMDDNGVKDVYPVLLAMANTYSSYLTTYEEYQIQRYEAASVIFGPHTLRAYISKYTELAKALATGEEVERGEYPPDLLEFPGDALNAVRIDSTPSGTSYGDVLVDVEPSYPVGQRVSVVFVGSNPRNDLKTDSSYLYVQRENETSGDWDIVATDAHFETRFYWDSDCHDVAFPIFRCRREQSSNATITWDIPDHQAAGNYRIFYQGVGLTTNSELLPYEATSGQFTVTIE